MEIESLFALVEKWKLTTLGEACSQTGGDIQTGPFGSQLHASDYVPVGVPSIMPKNIGDNRVTTDEIARITPEDAQRLSRYLVRKNDIVYSRRGDVERRSLIRDREEGWLCGTGCLRVRFGNNDVNSVYVSYYLGHPSVKEWIVRHAVGATMANLNTSILSALPISLPPLAEQRAIARILGSLDDKIELNRQTNQTLEAMASAIFKSWFVDFDPVRAKKEGRQPAYMDGATAELFPHEFEESVLGEIPKGWRVGKVDELAEIIRKGVHPNKFPDELFEHCSIPAFDEGQLPKSELGSEIKSNKYAVVENSVLLSKLNPQTSRVWLFNPYNKNRVVCSTEFLVTVARNHISREYLHALFTSQSFRDVFATLVTGTSGSHQRVKPQALLQMEALIPPQKVVVSFSKLARPIYEKKNHNIQQSQTLANIRDTLLPKLMSGEIRVKEAEKQIELSL